MRSSVRWIKPDGLFEVANGRMTVSGEVIKSTQREVRLRVPWVLLENRELLSDAELDIPVKDGLDYFATPEGHSS